MTNRKTQVDAGSSIEQARQGLANAMKSAFEGKPGVASRVKVSRKPSSQFKFTLNNKEKSNANRAVNEKILKNIFKNNSSRISSTLQRTMEKVIDSIVGEHPVNINILGRNVGTPKPVINIKQSPFGQFVKSKEAAGLLGLPDPDQSLEVLKVALSDAVTVTVEVPPTGPRVIFRFNLEKLLKRTPHPTLFEEKKTGTPFISWLQLVTGPKFVSAISGYSFVSVREMKVALTKESRQPRGLVRRGFDKKDSMKRLTGLDQMIKAPRTASYAGDAAGLMLLNKKRGLRLSSAEFAGGDGGDYRSPTKFEGYWEIWWNQVKQALVKWSRIIIRAVFIGVLRQERGKR